MSDPKVFMLRWVVVAVVAAMALWAYVYTQGKRKD
jgi:hypothetical protein